MKQVVVERPLSAAGSRSLQFFIGKDSRGRWVVQDERHLCGGLFLSRKDAFRFAMFENGHRPQAVIMVPGVLELDMSGQSNPADTSDSVRRVA